MSILFNCQAKTLVRAPSFTERHLNKQLHRRLPFMPPKRQQERRRRSRTLLKPKEPSVPLPDDEKEGGNSGAKSTPRVRKTPSYSKQARDDVKQEKSSRPRLALRHESKSRGYGFLSSAGRMIPCEQSVHHFKILNGPQNDYLQDGLDR